MRLPGLHLHQLDKKLSRLALTFSDFPDNYKKHYVNCLSQRLGCTILYREIRKSGREGRVSLKVKDKQIGLSLEATLLKWYSHILLETSQI